MLDSDVSDKWSVHQLSGMPATQWQCHYDLHMREDLACPKCNGDEFDMFVEWGSINVFECYCSCGNEWCWTFDFHGEIIEEKK